MWIIFFDPKDIFVSTIKDILSVLDSEVSLLLKLCWVKSLHEHTYIQVNWTNVLIKLTLCQEKIFFFQRFSTFHNVFLVTFASCYNLKFLEFLVQEFYSSLDCCNWTILTRILSSILNRVSKIIHCILNIFDSILSKKQIIAKQIIFFEIAIQERKIQLNVILSLHKPTWISTKWLTNCHSLLLVFKSRFFEESREHVEMFTT